MPRRTIGHISLNGGRGQRWETTEQTGSSDRDLSQEAREAVDQYWTPERRAAAQPAGLLGGSSGGAEGAHWRGGPATGTTGHLLPRHTCPESRTRQKAARARLAAYKWGLRVASTQSSLPLKYPYVACGKLFFTQGGTNWEGSACVTGPQPILLTAGHCLHLPGQWSSNHAFSFLLLSFADVK